MGEIVISGPNVMKGYWQRPEATAEAIRDGWFHSGDLGRVDEDGYFFIVDRKKDLIIRGGYNVYPREIEEVLYEHPAIAEAAVIGLPHPALGEEVGAAVALKPGAVITAEELRDHVQVPGRGLQVSAPRVDRRRAAEGPDRQDPQAGDRSAARTDRTVRVLLLAPPGAGKGTQGERLAARFGVRHIAAGDLLRSEAQAGLRSAAGSRAFRSAAISSPTRS